MMGGGEYFPVGILVQNLHPKQPNISKKNNQKMFHFKMAAKKRIFISHKKSCDQNMKNHFPQGIFQ